MTESYTYVKPLYIYPIILRALYLYLVIYGYPLFRRFWQLFFVHSLLCTKRKTKKVCTNEKTGFCAQICAQMFVHKAFVHKYKGKKVCTNHTSIRRVILCTKKIEPVLCTNPPTN